MRNSWVPHKSHKHQDMTIPFLPASCIRGCGTYHDSSGRTRIDEMYFKVRGSNLDDVKLSGGLLLSICNGKPRH